MPFFEMLPRLKNSEIDAAVLIHEGRFVFEREGLSLIEDLGRFWEKQTGAMVPLGCIYASTAIDEGSKIEFVADLHASLTSSLEEFKKKSPFYIQKMLPYMLEMAQEKDAGVVEAHIKTYVTSDTLELSDGALGSIDIFQQKIATAEAVASSNEVKYG